MNTTTLQVPLAKSLKAEAKIAARDYGFSSLQELVRFLLTKISKRELAITVEEPAVRMSKKAERRYAKMMRDFEMGRNVKTVHSIEELMKDLTS